MQERFNRSSIPRFSLVIPSRPMTRCEASSIPLHDGKHMKHSAPLCFLFAIAVLLFSCSERKDNEISASGTIEATDVTVSTKVGGQIVRLYVDEGSAVKVGDTLAVVDPTDYVIQLRQAEANAAALDAQYKLAVRGAREEDIIQAEASFRNALEDLRRMEELFAARSITQKQLDDARTRFTIAEQTLEKMKRGLRPEEIETARARRDQALAQLEAAKKKLADAYVTAPMEGIITQKAVERGEMVGPGSAIARISHLSKVFLTIYVSEVELGRVKLGQEARVQIDTYPDRHFPGKVIYISPIAEFTPKNVQTKDDRTKLVFGVKIEVENSDGALKPGMPADAVLEVGA